MSEANTPSPLGIDLNTAQNAIRAMIAPQEDTATTTEALEAEPTEQVEDAEMSDDDASYEEYSEDELEVEAEAEGQDDQSFDILGALVEVDGEEITVEELRRGNLRQKDYTRKTQELAETRKQYEAQYFELERERAQYAQLLPALQQRLEQPAEREPDWDTLYDTDPTMAAKAERQWRKQQSERQAQLEAVQQEQARMAQIQQQRMQQMQAQYVDQQREVLPDLIPEWRDSKVAAKEATELRDFLLEEGFTEEDVSGLANASLVKLARQAMLYSRGQTRATQAKAKPRPKTKTMKSGSRGSQPKPRAPQEQALQRARQTGRVDDAAAAIRSLL